MELPIKYFYRLDKGTCMRLPFSIQGDTIKQYTMSFFLRFLALPTHKLCLFKTLGMQFSIYNNGAIAAGTDSDMKRFGKSDKDPNEPARNPNCNRCNQKLALSDYSDGSQ